MSFDFLLFQRILALLNHGVRVCAVLGVVRFYCPSPAPWSVTYLDFQRFSVYFICRITLWVSPAPNHPCDMSVPVTWVSNGGIWWRSYRACHLWPCKLRRFFSTRAEPVLSWSLPLGGPLVPALVKCKFFRYGHEYVRDIDVTCSLLFVADDFEPVYLATTLPGVSFAVLPNTVFHMSTWHVLPRMGSSYMYFLCNFKFFISLWWT